MTTQPDYVRGGTQKAEYSPDELISVSCPYCGANDGQLLAVEHGSIGIRRCRECSLIYTSPRLPEPEAVYWGDYDNYLAEAKLIFSGHASHHRDPNYVEELELIESQRPQLGRFLDVGCNMGMLLRLARARGWDAVGVEPSPALRRIATEEFGLSVYGGFLDDLPEDEHGAFDVVALSDVFEHITAPREFLRSVSTALRPDGLLYVKVPNAKWSILKQRLGDRLGNSLSRDTWDSYEHVVHYTEATLRSMLRSEGFEPILVTFARPIQVPVWHHHVGQYFLYPSPWVLDWERHLGRLGFYRLAQFEHRLRGGTVGYCAPNLVALARSARSADSSRA